MGKRIFIIHGWGSGPDMEWFPWIKNKLEIKGYEVTLPQMPNTDNPQISSWVNKLREMVGKPRESDSFIGHSIGCNTIWRYLEQLEGRETVNKVIMVAPWVKLTNLEDEDWPIADIWTNTPLNFSKVKMMAKSFVAIFSDNDPYVPLAENKEFVEKQLDSKVIILKQRGHFNEDFGIKQIPEILDLL